GYVIPGNTKRFVFLLLNQIELGQLLYVIVDILVIPLQLTGQLLDAHGSLLAKQPQKLPALRRQCAEQRVLISEVQPVDGFFSRQASLGLFKGRKSFLLKLLNTSDGN